MLGVSYARWWAVVSTVLLAGCAHHLHRHTPSQRGSAPQQSLEETLSPARPHSFSFDDRRVGSLDEVDRRLRLAARPPADYHALSAEDCQCRAAQASEQGNTLAAERRAIGATFSPHGISEEEALKLRVLRATELEARNKSAALALTVYYHLAEAEANRELLQRGLKEIDAAQVNLGALREHGVQVPFDRGDLDRQRLDLKRKQIDLEYQLSKLNTELISLIGLTTENPRARIWPTTDWAVVVTPIDAEQSVQEALAWRPELGLIETLRSSLRSGNVDVTRGVLGGASGLLGMQTRFTGLISLLGMREFLGQRRSNRLELPERRRQLDDYARERRREVANETRQAVAEIETRLREIAIAKEEILSWQRQLDELAAKTRIDEASFIDITRARLKRLDAEGTEIGRIADWKIALATLKQAQGRLIAECQGPGHVFQPMTVADPQGRPLENLSDEPILEQPGLGPLPPAEPVPPPEPPMPPPDGDGFSGVGSEAAERLAAWQQATSGDPAGINTLSSRRQAVTVAASQVISPPVLNAAETAQPPLTEMPDDVVEPETAAAPALDPEA